VDLSILIHGYINHARLLLQIPRNVLTFTIRFREVLCNGGRASAPETFMRLSSRPAVVVLSHWAALWKAGDYRYRWKAARLRFRRRMVGLWPLWLLLLAINLIETQLRRWFADATVIHKFWVRLHVLGLGLAGTVALLIMIGLLIEASIKTTARRPSIWRPERPNYPTR
jgi:hypothetical protein